MMKKHMTITTVIFEDSNNGNKLTAAKRIEFHADNRTDDNDKMLNALKCHNYCTSDELVNLGVRNIARRVAELSYAGWIIQQTVIDHLPSGNNNKPTKEYRYKLLGHQAMLKTLEVDYV